MGRNYTSFLITLTLSFLSITTLYAATYNATGIWTASSYGGWVNLGNAGCVKDPNKTVSAIINQTGDTISFVADGTLYTGTVSGSDYTVSSSRPSEGGTTTVTYQISLASANSGSGTTTWSWTDGYYSCNGGGSFTITKLTGPASYDATGVWYYSTSGNWADGCYTDSPESGYLAIIQNSDTFTYTDQRGIHTGRIVGTESLSSIRYPEDAGYTTQVIHITMSGSSNGIGTVTWTWTDGYASCNGGSIISIWKQPTDVTYDASGEWTYIAGTTSGTLTISQENNELRVNGFNGSHFGVVSSENYIAIASYPSNNGTMTESILFSLNSGMAATGRIERYWTNGYSEDWSSKALSLTKTSLVNAAPAAPGLSSPKDGAIEIPKTVTLQAGVFSDLDSGDFHSQTEWQISTSSDFSSKVLGTTSDVNLTSYTVPEFTLVSGNQYWWRVKFYDSNLKGSNWSGSRSFTVTSVTNDANDNGIPDKSENSTVDLDNDGTIDNNQTDIIKSMDTAIGSGQMGVSRKDDLNISSIDSINSIDPDSISSVARPHYMPLGMINLGLSVIRPADSVDVKIYFSQAAPANVNWYMYNPIHGWMDYSAKGLASFSSDRKSVTVRLKDWGYGDSDGIANGIIVDPSGYGIASWIKGAVTDSSTGQKITSATLSFEGIELSLNSLLDGNFLSMILPGTYNFTVSAPNYTSQTLSNVPISEGAIVTKDIVLSSKVTEQQVAELYVATFNRAPDKPGLDFWVNDSGFTIEQIAESFFDQTETQNLYPPGTTETVFVTSAYDNLFNRAPDVAGLDYWVDALVSGAVTRPVMIEAVKNGAQGTDAEIVANKAEVGLYYASLGLEGGGFSLAGITDDVATIAAAKIAVDNL